MSWFSAQDLVFSQCLVDFAYPNVCHDLESSNGLYCNKKTIRLSPVSSAYLSNNREYSPGSIKVAIYGESATAAVHHDFIDYLVENQLTSQCHVITAGHFISFDQKKYQLKQAGAFILHSNGDFFSAIQLQECGQNLVCPCGLRVVENERVVQINRCKQALFPTTDDGFKVARNATVVFVSKIFSVVEAFFR